MCQMMSSSSAFGGEHQRTCLKLECHGTEMGLPNCTMSSTCAEHKGLAGGGGPNKIVHFKRVNQVEPMWNPWGIHVSSISFPTKQHLSNSKTWNLYWNHKPNKAAKQPNFLQGMFFETTPCLFANIFRIIPHFHLWIFGVRVVEMMIPSLSWAFERSAY